MADITKMEYRYNQDADVTRFVSEGGRVFVKGSPTAQVKMKLGYFTLSDTHTLCFNKKETDCKVYNIGFDDTHPISLFGIRDHHLYKKTKPYRTPLKYEISEKTREETELYEFSRHNAEELLNALKVMYEVSKYYVSCIRENREDVLQKIREYFYSRLQYKHSDVRKVVKDRMIDAMMELIYGICRLLLDTIERCVPPAFKREDEIWDVNPWIPAHLLDYYLAKLNIGLKVQCKKVSKEGEVIEISGAKDKGYLRCADARALLNFMGVWESGSIRVIKHEDHNRYNLTTWAVYPKGRTGASGRCYCEPVVRLNIEQLVKVFWDLEVFIKEENKEYCRIKDYIGKKVKKKEKNWLRKLISKIVKFQCFEALRALDGFHVLGEKSDKKEKDLIDMFNFIDKVVDGRYNGRGNISIGMALRESEEVWEAIKKARMLTIDSTKLPSLHTLDELLINFSVGHKSLRDFVLYMLDKKASKFFRIIQLVRLGEFEKANIVLHGKAFLEGMEKEENRLDKRKYFRIKEIYDRRGEKVRHRIRLRERNVPELLYLYVITSTRLPKIKKYSVYTTYAKYVRTLQWGLQFRWRGLKEFVDSEGLGREITKQKFMFDRLVELIDRVDEWKDGGNYLVNYSSLPDLFYVSPSRLKYSTYMKRFNAKALLVSPIMAIAHDGWYETNVKYILGNRVRLYYYDHLDKETVDEQMKSVLWNAGVKIPSVADGSVNDVAYGLAKRYANRMFQFFGVLKCLSIVTDSYSYIGMLGTSRDCGLYLLHKYSEWLRDRNLSDVHNLNPTCRYFRQFLNEWLDGHYSPFKIPDLFVAFRSTIDNGKVGRKTVNVVVTKCSVDKPLMDRIREEWEDIPFDLLKDLYIVGRIVELPKKLARQLERMGHVFIIRDTRGENYTKAIEKAQKVREIADKKLEERMNKHKKAS